ncbi:TonB-dependent receptor [Pelagicoccus sp. SDUM812002]|uniref:TonB-dependent receptor n=1 Tax=Pelagicoccus sp. SDUM812002 TaxID=3041266 RepID=UPI00280E3B67|nr:TonB-dependent receptor [Pelagicoccus sp. SDUM812002]MDQ8186743.1 TonB-dependent receptor [Pelagicoccus sp. SDUM812002]
MKLSSRMRISRVSASARALPRFLTLFVAVLASGMSAFGQETGRITGRVQDAATGRYMENVTVTVNETGDSVRSSPDGTYRLTGLPVGTVSLDFEHLGYFTRSAMVEVAAGQTASPATIALKSSNTFDDEDEVFDLDAFEVKNEVDAYSRAINQQRTSDYNVNVVDAGTFGDVTEGNVGEFVKFLPGVNINYVAADARTITVRGMADNFTTVTVDGNRMASASSGAKARDFELEQLSINNVERLEVVKVPTPDLSADSLGGAVNLVSKSAFERDGREIKYRVYVSANSEDLTFSSTPGPGDFNSSKIKPGIDLSYSDVFKEGTLGVIFNYTSSNQFNEQHRARLRWVTDNDFDDEGVGTPILRRYQIQDGPKITNRESFHLKTDYKLGENTILSGSLQFNDYSSEFRNRNITWDTNITEVDDSDGNDADAVISPTYMLGDVGRGDIDLGGSYRDKYGDTWHGDFSIKHYGDVWTYEAGFASSTSTNYYSDFSRGMIMAVIGDDDYGGRFEFSDISDPISGGVLEYTPTLTLYDSAGNVDPTFGVSSLTGFDLDEVQTREQDAQDEFTSVNFDMKRNIRVGESTGYIKLGTRLQKQERSADRDRTRIIHAANVYDDTGLPAEEYYSGEDALHIGPGVIAWPDYVDIYDYFAANPDNFDFNHPSRFEENIVGAANDVFAVEEKISAAYIMAQLKFLESKLRVTGGVRYEKTDVVGEGGYFDESLGNGIEDPVEQFAAQWSQRKVSEASYDDFHPSLHFVYDVTDRFTVRLAYANTIGRQDFGSIVPYLDIDRPGEEEGAASGQIEFNNTGLLPQSSDNYDLTFEYYPQSGGSITAGLFKKKISNYIESFSGTIDQLSAAEFETFDLPAFLLDVPEYGYTTDLNSGTATVDGLEIGYFRSLEGAGLPDWFSAFSINANVTYLDVERIDDDGVVFDELADMVEESYNLGITYDRKPLKIQLKFNSKGEQLLENFTDMRTYHVFGEPEYTAFQLYRDKLEQVDLNVDCKINEKTTIFVSGRNIFNKEQKQFIANADRSIVVPERIEEFGVQWALGVKGRF